MKFAHMADCHIGGWRESKLTEFSVLSFLKACDKCIELEVDFIIIAGDLFNSPLPTIDQLKIVVKKLKLIKDKGISLLAIAMLDVGREQVDQATGLSKVYVNVMGYILDSRGKFTKKIASVGPIQYSGIGENPKVAKVNALVSASTSAAKDLIDQLRAKEGL